MNWARRLGKISLVLSLTCFLSVCISSCSKEDTLEEIKPPVDNTDEDNHSDNNNPTNNPNEDDDMAQRQITITIGTASFTATLEDNATGKAFQTLLPMTIEMSELGGNEKYYYASSNLPTASYTPGTIHEGDLMLYGTSCIVLFYQTFSSSYSYTRIGKVDNPQGLATAVGTGKIAITFNNKK